MNFRNYLSKLSIVDYIRQLSIVIAGIMITFGVSDMLTERAEQKDIRKIMKLMVTELESNTKNINSHKERFLKEGYVFGIMMANKDSIRSIPPDTISKYANIPFNFEISYTHNYALEAFKVSRAVQNVENQEILMEVFKAYSHVAGCYKFSEFYYKEKEEAIRSLSDSIDKDDLYAKWQNVVDNKKYSSFMESDFNTQISVQMNESIAKIKEIIDMVKEEYKLAD